MAFKRHRELAVQCRYVLLQQQAHGRRALQGDEIFGQQLRPADFGQLGQRGIGGHHSNEAVQVQRVEAQAVGVFRFEADAQFDAAVAHQFKDLLVDHVVHRDVDLRVTLAKHLE